MAFTRRIGPTGLADSLGGTVPLGKMARGFDARRWGATVTRASVPVMLHVTGPTPGVYGPGLQPLFGTRNRINYPRGLVVRAPAVPQSNDIIY